MKSSKETTWGRLAGVLCAMALVLFTIGNVPTSRADTPPAAPAITADIARGEAMQNILSQFEAHAEQARKDWGVPGMAMAVVQDDKMIYAKGFGTKALGGSEPVDENTVFQIGSTSKAFTSALVAQLVTEGRLKWDDKVVDYLPDFAMSDPWVAKEFTVEDLLAMRSGLPEHVGDTQYFLGYSREDLMRSLRNIQPTGQFRVTYGYNNLLYTTAGQLIEAVTGESYEQNLQDRIFGPLGMASSSADQASFLSAKDVVTTHQMREGKMVPLTADWPFLSWSYVAGAAGAINSNVVDMAKWMRLQLNGGKFDGEQVVGQAELDNTHAPRTLIFTSGNVQASYGLGWINVGTSPYTVVWHSGGLTGIQSNVTLIPEARIGIVILSNLGGHDLADDLAGHFYGMLFGNTVLESTTMTSMEQDLASYKQQQAQALADRAEIDSQGPVPPARPQESYTGSYQSALYGAIDIAASEDNSSLIATVGPNKVELALYPMQGDTFRTSMPQYQEYGASRFLVGPDGRAQAVAIGVLGSDETGTFWRVE